MYNIHKIYKLNLQFNIFIRINDCEAGKFSYDSISLLSNYSPLPSFFFFYT